MNTPTHPLPESSTDRRTRQLDYFRRAADKAMRTIDIASEQLEAAHATGEPGATASPTLDLARASRALTLLVNAENRVVAGQAPLRAPASDPRRALLAEALHQAAKLEPDPRTRAALIRDVDERIEEALLLDPDAEIVIGQHLVTIANDLDLALDMAKLSDRILGIEKRIIPPPGYHDPHADTDDPFDL